MRNNERWIREFAARTGKPSCQRSSGPSADQNSLASWDTMQTSWRRSILLEVERAE